MSFPDFAGSPCGHYASYTFYKGIKFYKQGKKQVINLGEFFFVRISAKHDPCIGEMELLWMDHSSENRLSSVRLYFLPEQTPQGRLASHGQDEVLMASDKVVLRLEDLVSWITDQVEWNHGLIACCPEENDTAPAKVEDIPVLLADHQSNGTKETELLRDSASSCTESVEDTRTSPPTLPQQEVNSPAEKLGSSQEDSIEATQILCQENGSVMTDQDDISDAVRDKDNIKVAVFPYPTYCRYRSVLKRLEGRTSAWISNVLVIALGAATNVGKNTHILFCRDTFDHEELAHHELNCEYLAPTLKVKKRRKKGKNGRSTSPGSESNTSEESKEALVKSNEVNNGFKQPPCKTEQEFLQKLYKFMKKRKTPIHRVPHLGFKQIDLFVFFSFAQKLGGYDKITGKRLWKHVYDVLGGDPGSTSAATCTRRHYEKLLLPFERFMDGKEYKPKQSRKQARPQKKSKEEEEEEDEGEMLEKSSVVGCKGESEDAYAFTDSNHENSKDSLLNEEQHSGEDIQMPDNYSDEDSKSIWSIQKSIDGKEDDQEKNGNKPIKPLIIQKEHNESFSEKERKWNEIRRKNALARKWVRQLRPSRGGKMPGAEKFSSAEKESLSTQQKIGHPSLPDIVKTETNALTSNNINDIHKSPITVSPKIKQELLEPSNSDLSMVSHLQEKYLPIATQSERKPEFCGKNSFYTKSEPFVSSKGNQVQAKLEPPTADKKSWGGYSRDGVYQVAPAPERYPYGCGFEMSMIHSFMKQEYKPGAESSASKPYLMCGNSSESSALSSAEQDPNSESKPNLSQRRPSVIQHTEYVTSPSPSQSPKQLSSDVYSEQNSRDMHLSFGSSTKMPSTMANHLAHSMTGKVNEWLAKGVPEAVACKTPCVIPEKTNELHDKVLMPSSCKTPGPGTGKVPMYGNKNRIEPFGYAGSSKPVRDKGSANYRHSVAQDIKKSASYTPNPTAKASVPYQKTFHPSASMVGSLNPYAKPGTKTEQTLTVGSKNKLYVSDPVYSQPKRHKLNTVPLTSPLPPRPSMLPFTRQQTYRTSPLSDIPKITGSGLSDCSNEVLDLSVKKKLPVAASVKPLPLHNNLTDQANDGAVCLDLSVKKKFNSSSRENAIENITPPLPQAASSHSSSKPFKPVPTLLTLHEVIESNRQKALSNSKPAAMGSSPQPSIPISSPAVPSNSAAYATSAQNKIPANFITQLPEASFTKEMAKNLYLAPDPSQFPPYVIPSFYAANWSAANSVPSVTHSTPTASPNIFKEAMAHGVFPKQYMYNFKQQFHPLLCKDNGCYPPSCK